MSRPSRKKINKKTLVLNDILDQIDLIDTHTHTQYSIQKLQNTYTFQCTVSWRDHMTGSYEEMQINHLTKFNIYVW